MPAACPPIKRSQKYGDASNVNTEMSKVSRY